MPFAPVNGIQIYYEEYGKGPATIVFAHGAGGNHLSWWQQVPFFSKKYRCITFSHRNFHLSPDRPGGPGVAAFVDDLAGLLDYLKIKETVLVAQSMGGTTCFGFLLAHPARVKALVMSDTIAGIPSARIRQLRADMVKEREKNGIRELSYSATFPEREPEKCFLYEEIRSLNQGYGRTELAATTPPTPPDADFSMIKAPVLFLFGSEDVLMPPPLGKLAHILIPGSRYVEIADAGHSTYFEKPRVQPGCFRIPQRDWNITGQSKNNKRLFYLWTRD
jgi:3-oxoadipate enol-lactonase